MYDEPTTGLDPITVTEIIDLMIEIQKIQYILDKRYPRYEL